MLVFAAATWWQGALLSLSLALAMAGIGFGIQHDANHGAYSDHGAVNRLMGMTLDMLGASSYVWHCKHNVSHHTYTNIDGADDDIDFVPFARLSPRPAALPLSPLPASLPVGALLVAVPEVEPRRRLQERRRGDESAGTAFPRPRGWDLVELVAGKLLFFGWAFVIPLMFHPWWVVLLFYVTTALVLGITLARRLPAGPLRGGGGVPRATAGDGAACRAPWAVHQVQTTVDFAAGNRLLTWYVGGLNFQIEHHLFPAHLPRPLPAHRGDPRAGVSPSSASATSLTGASALPSLLTGAGFAAWDARRWRRRPRRGDGLLGHRESR